jgi:hypothetical protein
MVNLKTDAGKGNLTRSNLAGRLSQIKRDLPKSEDLIRGSLEKV